MGHELERREGGALQLAAEVAGWQAEQVDLLKRSVLPENARSDADLLMLAHVAKRTGLDPLARQLYAIPKRGGGLTVSATIDGLRLVAQRTGEYRGRLGPEWCGADGQWRDVWLGEPDDLVACRVGVLREGFAAPVWATALLREFRQNTPNWGPTGIRSHMLAKVAEALALRAAFPQELSGLYTDDELHGRQGFPQEPATDPHLENLAAGSAGFGEATVRTVWESVGSPNIGTPKRKARLEQLVREHLAKQQAEQDTGDLEATDTEPTSEVQDDPTELEGEVVEDDPAPPIVPDDLQAELEAELMGDSPKRRGRGGHRDPQA